MHSLSLSLLRARVEQLCGLIMVDLTSNCNVTEAARHMIENQAAFARKVKETLRGGTHFGHEFPRLL